MVKIDLQALDRDIFVRGDDAIARTITIGQTGAVDDDVVVDSANWSVTAAGIASFNGNVTLNAGLTSPQGSSGEVFGLNAGNGASHTGFGNHIFGNGSGSAITSGNNNTIIGLNAGDGISTGSSNVAIGNLTMGVVNADNQIAIGNAAMRYFEGDNSIAIGSSAMAGSQVTPLTAEFCVAIGTNVMQIAEGAAWNNVGIGGSSLAGLTTGLGNTCIGKQTGLALTTGGGNVFIGNACGDNTITGGSNILIGPSQDTTTTSTTGELRIHFAGGANIPLISGDMVAGHCGINTLPADQDATLHITTDAGDTISCLKLEQDDADDEFIDFEGTTAANALQSISSLTAGNTIQGFFRVNINGTIRWMPFYDAPTS
jgi:hypothetical protein